MNERPPLDEPRLAAWLRLMVYAAVGFAFAFPLTPPRVALAIAGGAGIGALVGRLLAGSRLRLLPILLASAFGLLALSVGLDALARSSVLASAMGPASVVVLQSAIGLGVGAVCVSTALRALALRQRLFRALEVAFVGFAFAQLVAGHRGGAINRPFELADSTIAQGGDPTVALLSVGALAAVACVLLLLSERSVWRALLHLALAAGLLATVLTTTRMLGLPQAKPASEGLGLRPDKANKNKSDHQKPGGRTTGERSDNEQLEFRDDYESQGRQIPLAVVLLHDDYSPPGGLYYFRQAAFSQYNGRRLVAATRADVDDDLAPGFVFADTHLPEVPNEQGDRMRLETTVALMAEHNRPFALESPIELRPEDNPDPGRFRRAYRVVSEAFNTDYDSLLGRGVGNPAWSDAQRAHYLQAPSDKRYAELAQKIASEMPEHLRDDPVAKGMMVSLWLGREGIYSLKSGHAGAEDPTADFLFGDRTGYCVHFAHAAAYLMRALGVPARVGAGYAIEESARQGGSAMLLSGSNSHAWPEIYVTGVGWVVLDVAPQRSLDPPMSPPDPDLQRLLGEMARGEKPLPQGEEKMLEPFVELARGLPALLGRTLLILLPSLLLFGYGVKLWRRLAPAWAPLASVVRVAYRADLDRLSELSLRRQTGESQEAFAVRVVAQSPSFGLLTREHVAAYFGRNPRAERPRLRELSRAVRSELAGAINFRRRLLGALHPFSWLSSR